MLRATSNDNDDDPEALLNYDPAAVAIGATGDEETLRRLKEFAAKLTTYVYLAEHQHQPPAPQPAPAPPAPAPHQQAQQQQQSQQQQAQQQLKPPPISPPQQKEQQKEQQKAPVAAAARYKEETTESQDSSQSESEARHNIVSTIPPAKDNNSSPPVGGRLKLEEEEPRKKRAVEPGPPQPEKAYSSRPPKCQKISTDGGTARKPKTLASGFNGDMPDSQLRRSAGRTRKDLNRYIQALGLTASFGQGVISKQGRNVSHITLNYEWNNLPRDESENLEWWVGCGPSRLVLASPLDPSKQDQPKKGIPVFWARGRSSSGGDLCHYIGHFRCVGFSKHATTTKLKGQDRQALLEFEFVRFDSSLSQKISKIDES